MAQSKNITPGHPIVKTSIPSDRLSATGRGSVTKGTGATLRVTSDELNHGTGKYGGKVAGRKADRYEDDLC
jgi:hypothetical protein